MNTNLWVRLMNGEVQLSGNEAGGLFSGHMVCARANQRDPVGNFKVALFSVCVGQEIQVRLEGRARKRSWVGLKLTLQQGPHDLGLGRVQDAWLPEPRDLTRDSGTLGFLVESTWALGGSWAIHWAGRNGVARGCRKPQSLEDYVYFQPWAPEPNHLLEIGLERFRVEPLLNQ
jgi:hypothetical protein